MQDGRARGENIPPLCRDPRMLQYGEVGQFSMHLQRVFDIVGRDRCLVLLFEDLLNAPRETYLNLLDFDGDGAPRLNDAVAILGYLFLEGSPPALGLGCVRIAGCPDMCGG